MPIISKALEKFKNHCVLESRLNCLRRHFLSFIPTIPGEKLKVLDVGSGDGLVALTLSTSRPDLEITGIDIKERAESYLPVVCFDGKKIPYPDASFDISILVDVLHHIDDLGLMKLLREVKRVTRRFIFLKDHLAETRFDVSCLKFMDNVENKPFGINLPYNYGSKEKWLSAFQELDLTVDCWCEKIGMYPVWADWLFGRNLHFIAKLSAKK